MDAQNIIVFGFIQNRVFNYGSRRNHSRNTAFYNSLCGAGILQLVTYRDFIAVFNQPADITVYGVMWDPRTWVRVFKSTVASCERDLKDACRSFSILENIS